MNKNKKIIVGIIHYNSGNIGNLVKTVSKFTKNIIIVKNKSDFFENVTKLFYLV